MSLESVLAYIRAGKTDSKKAITISEIELAEHYGCSLVEGQTYTLHQNGHVNADLEDQIGYTLLPSKYILQDGRGGMFSVMLLQCDLTERLGIILNNGRKDLFSALLAVGHPN